MNSDQLVKEITELFISEFGVSESISPAADFADFEFDSLVLVEAAVVLSKRYGVDVSGNELQEAGSVEKAAALLVAKGA